jgi:secreted trypsin-like serine protease
MEWMRKLAASIAGAVTVMAALGVTPAYAIVKGADAAPGEFPYMAGLVEMSSAKVFCGGTLLSEQYVLTAAGCLQSRQASNVVVLVGDVDYTTGAETPTAAVYEVSAFIVHPNFDPKTRLNDIALIKLAKPVTFNAGVRAALLPSTIQLSTNQLFTNSKAELTGWGATSMGGPDSTKLQKTQTTVIPNTVCAQSYGNIQNSQICTFTRGTGSCSNDTGGPLTVKIQQQTFVVGVVSYAKGCASSSPEVNTRVTSYVLWIKSNAPGLEASQVRSASGK